MSEIGVMFCLRDVMLDGVLEVVDVDGLDVELVVVMFHFFQILSVCFTSGSRIKLVAELV